MWPNPFGLCPLPGRVISRREHGVISSSRKEITLLMLFNTHSIKRHRHGSRSQFMHSKLTQRSTPQHYFLLVKKHVHITSFNTRTLPNLNNYLFLCCKNAYFFKFYLLITIFTLDLTIMPSVCLFLTACSLVFFSSKSAIAALPLFMSNLLCWVSNF